jgi:hypothetical protein
LTRFDENSAGPPPVRLGEFRISRPVDILPRGSGRAALAGLAGQSGAAVSAAEGEEEAARATDRLYKAVAMGYRSPDAYRNEDALDPLRDRDDFRLMMMDLAVPAKPFAAAR